MKFVYPVLIGLMATAVAGLILIPVGYIFFSLLVNLHLFTDENIWALLKEIIITIGMLWFMISSTCGGFASVQFIEEKEDFAIFLLIVSSFIIGDLVFKGQLWTIEAIPVILIFIVGYILGGWLGLRHKKKNLKQKQIQV